jgi:hypothetical protein
VKRLCHLGDSCQHQKPVNLINRDFIGDITVQIKRFADLWRGVFFMAASISLFIVMGMFIFVWQPIWKAGFKDFNTISGAISKLNETAKPSSEIAPLLLVEISKMNDSLNHIKTTMLTIDEINLTMKSIGTSMKTIEDINPNIIRMNMTLDNMNYVMSGQMAIMSHEVDQMGDKFSPYGMLPFNW